jgi:hypothetical protein
MITSTASTMIFNSAINPMNPMPYNPSFDIADNGVLLNNSPTQLNTSPALYSSINGQIPDSEQFAQDLSTTDRIPAIPYSSSSQPMPPMPNQSPTQNMPWQASSNPIEYVLPLSVDLPSDLDLTAGRQKLSAPQLQSKTDPFSLSTVAWLQDDPALTAIMKQAQQGMFFTPEERE